MKAITSVITILLFTLAGCSPEEATALKKEEALSFNVKNGGSIPNNPANTFDYVGGIYTSLLDQYYIVPQSNPTLQQAILYAEGTALFYPSVQTLLVNEDYTPVTTAAMQIYIDAQDEDIPSLLHPGYSNPAVQVYLEIASQLKALKQSDAPYDQVYEMLTSIEAGSMADSAISTEERNAILTTTSILRNALYHDIKRKRRDRDWDWMIGNVVATANGALESKPQALLMSLATDIWRQ